MGFARRIHEDGRECRRGALRELQEETGSEGAYIRQFHTFTAPQRDPRERVITIAYYALVRMQEGWRWCCWCAMVCFGWSAAATFDHDQITPKSWTCIASADTLWTHWLWTVTRGVYHQGIAELYEVILNVLFDHVTFTTRWSGWKCWNRRTKL